MRVRFTVTFAAFSSAVIRRGKSSTTWLGLSLLVASVLACHPHSASESPTIAGRHAWHEVQTPHLVIQGDLDREDMLELAATYEQLTLVLEKTLFGKVINLDTRAPILVFRRESAFKSATGLVVAQHAATEHLTGESGSNPTLILSGGQTVRDRSIFLHEMSHRLLSMTNSGMPAWLEEGLSQYYSAINIEDSNIFVGENPPEVMVSSVRGASLPRNQPAWHYSLGDLTPPSTLLALSNDEFISYARRAEQTYFWPRKEKLNYVSAWLFTHLLSTGPAEFRTAYLALLTATSQGEDVDAAVTTAFSKVSAKQIDEAFYQHAKTRSRFTLPLTPELQRPALTASQVRELRGEEVQKIQQQLAQKKCTQAPEALALRQHPQRIQESATVVADAFDPREFLQVFRGPSAPTAGSATGDEQASVGRDFYYVAERTSDMRRFATVGAFCPRGPMLCGDF